MLTADYSLDLRDVTGCSLGGGFLRYDRAKIEQVMPRAGRYTVGCESASGQHTAELTVREDSIDLAADEQEQVAAVVFR